MKPWSFDHLDPDVREYIGDHPPEVEFAVAAVIDQDSDEYPPTYDEAVAIVAAKYDLNKDSVDAWLRQSRLVRKVTKCLKQGRELRNLPWVRWLRRMSLL